MRSPGRSRRSIWRAQRSGTKFTCTPPPMRPTLPVAGPRSGWGREARAAWRRSTSRMNVAAWLMALMPRWGFEEWAARPWKIISHRTTPLVATTTRISVGSATMAARGLRLGCVAGRSSHSRVTPRNRYSSSITAASQMSQGGTTPDRWMSSTAWSIPARPAFVSHEPRPYIRPPSIAGVNGGIVMPAMLTTSM